MRGLQTVGLTCVMAAMLLPWSAAAQEGPRPLAVQAYGGFGNDPAGFDAYRKVAFDRGIRLGAGLTVGFSDYLSIRFDAATVLNSGRDQTLGAIDQAVDFRRSYYSATLQLSRPLASGFTPYLVLGGGLVRLDREANEYWYGLTQFAGVAGVGASFPLTSRLSVFAEGTGWIYDRQTVGESQFDKNLSLGLRYDVVH